MLFLFMHYHVNREDTWKTGKVCVSRGPVCMFSLKLPWKKWLWVATVAFHRCLPCSPSNPDFHSRPSILAIDTECGDIFVLLFSGSQTFSFLSFLPGV